MKTEIAFWKAFRMSATWRVVLYYLKEIIVFLTEKCQIIITVHKNLKICKIKNILTFIYIC